MALADAGDQADLTDKMTALMAATDAQVDAEDNGAVRNVPDEAPPTPSIEALPAAPEAAPPLPTAEVVAVPGQGTQPDQSTRLSQENADLKSRLASVEETLKALKEPAAQAPVTPQAPPPEIADLDNSIGAIAQSFVEVEGQIRAAETQKAQWINYQNNLTGDLLNSDSDPNIDVSKIRAELRKASNAVGQYERYIDGRYGVRGGLVQQGRTLETLKATTQKILDLERYRTTTSEKEAERDETVAQTTWRSGTWDPAVKAQFARIPQAHHERFANYAKKLARAETYQGPISDAATFAGKLADDYLAILRDGAHTYAAQKVADATVASPANGKAAAPATQRERGLKTDEDLRSYLDEEWSRAKV